MLDFDKPAHELSSIIKVIGVGGGGSNAVNHMFKLGILGVDFIVCNTDKQALAVSPVPNKIQLGATLTEGLGAGAVPEVGKNAAIESINEIRDILNKNTKMVFITAGMGGGTGTGAAPIIASVAKELDILTVGIITVPFSFEGKKRKTQAEQGIEEMKKNVDTLLVISNEKLREIHGNLKLTEAFAKADDVLSTAAKSIAEIISLTLHINVDFNDIRTVMKDSGVAIMGSSTASGEGRAVRAVENALCSPLLNDSNITGARYVLLNVTSGKDEMSMDELGEITDYIQEAAGQTAEIIQGYGVDVNQEEDVKVTIIATGFQSSDPLLHQSNRPEIKKISLVEETPVAVQEPVVINEMKPEPFVEVENKLYEEPFLKTTTTVTEHTIENKSEEVVSSVESVNQEPFLKSTTELINEVDQEQVVSENIEFEIDQVSFNQETNETEIREIRFNLFDENEVLAEDKNETNVPEELPEIYSSVNTSASEEITLRVVNETPQNVINDITSEISSSVRQEQESSTISKSDEYYQRTQERISKLKDLSFKLKTPNGLSQMENEPAYVRRGVNLNNTQHSSESSVSRFTLTENEEKKIEIRPNNSFLHDNVD